MTQPDPSDGTMRPLPDKAVLRRMLEARSQARLGQGGAPQLPQPPAPTPARAAGTALGRAADQLYGLSVQPIAVLPGALTLAELPELLPDLPLVAVLQGPGDHLGAIALCPQTVTALIEIQALGRVTTRPVERRRPTRSDAMLCADFINGLLTELPIEMEGVEGFDAVAGYRYLTHLEDARPLALMLEDRPFRSLSFQLRMGVPDSREGSILLALPQSAPPRVRAEPTLPAPVPAAQEAGAVLAAEKPRATLQAAMSDAPVEVRAVLCRRQISLADLRALTQGRLLHLPRSCLSEATVETAAGQVLAHGKFGEAEGRHAIRLRDSALPAGQDRPQVQGDAEPVVGIVPPPGDLSQPDPFRPSVTTGGALVAGPGVAVAGRPD